jgi:hypothetical protein
MASSLPRSFFFPEVQNRGIPLNFSSRKFKIAEFSGIFLPRDKKSRNSAEFFFLEVQNRGIPLNFPSRRLKIEKFR